MTNVTNDMITGNDVRSRHKVEGSFRTFPTALFLAPFLSFTEIDIIERIINNTDFRDRTQDVGCMFTNRQLSKKTRCQEAKVRSAIQKAEWLGFCESKIYLDAKNLNNKTKNNRTRREIFLGIPNIPKELGIILELYKWRLQDEHYILGMCVQENLNFLYKNKNLIGTQQINWDDLFEAICYVVYDLEKIEQEINIWGIENIWNDHIKNWKYALKHNYVKNTESPLKNALCYLNKYEHRYTEIDQINTISQLEIENNYKLFSKIENQFNKLYNNKMDSESEIFFSHLRILQNPESESHEKMCSLTSFDVGGIVKFDEHTSNDVPPLCKTGVPPLCKTGVPPLCTINIVYIFKYLISEYKNLTSLNSVLTNAEKELHSSDGLRETNPQQTRKRKRNTPASDFNQNSNQIDKSSKLQRSPAPESNEESIQINNNNIEEKCSASRKRENEQALTSTQTDRNIARNDSDSFDESNSVKVAESDSDPVSESNTMSSKLKKKQAEKKTKLRSAKKSKTPELKDDPRYMEKYKVEIRLFNYWISIKPDNFWKPKSIKFCANNNPVHSSISALNKMITGKLYSKEEAESKLNGVPATEYFRKYQPMEIENGMLSLIENIKPGMRFSNQSEWIRKKNLAQLIKDDFADKKSYLIQSIYYGASIKESILNGLDEDEIIAFEIWNTFFKKTKKIQSLQLKDQQSIVFWIKDIKTYSKQKVSHLAKCMIAPFNPNSNELYEYVLNVKDFKLNGAATANAFKPNGKLFPIVDEAYQHVYDQSFFQYTTPKMDLTPVKVQKVEKIQKELSREELITGSIKMYASEVLMNYYEGLPESYEGWYWKHDDVYYGIIAINQKDMKINFYGLNKNEMLGDHVHSIDVHDIKYKKTSLDKKWGEKWIDSKFKKLFLSE